MTIKSHLPWPLKIVVFAVMLGFGAAVAKWTYELGRSFTGSPAGPTYEQIAELKKQIASLAIERDQYLSTASAAESQINMERSAQKQMAAQVKTLEADNARLKEDLAFFESLLPASTGAPGIAIRRLKAEIIGPNQLRYRLLVMQGGKGDQDFAGNLQLAVTVVLDGKSAMMVFPEGKPGDAEKYKLGFRHYQRMEGVLTLPEGAVMKAVQARILEKGQIRTQQSVNL